MRHSVAVLLVSVCYVLLASAPARADISQGLMAYYPFNGNAMDESGNANNGVPVGVSPVEDRFGRAATAYAFDGVNDTIWVANSPSLNMQEALTISAWIYLDSYADEWTSVVNKWQSYVLQLNPIHGLTLTVYDRNFKGLWHNLSVRQEFALGQWYHVAGTFDELTGMAALYINGAPVPFEPRSDFGFPVSVNESSDDIKLGSENNNQWWHGRIDDVRIYNRALVATEIADLYNETPREQFQQRLLELLVQGLQIDTASGEIRLHAKIDPADPVFNELLHNPEVRLSLELQTGSDEQGDAQFGAMAQGQVPMENLDADSLLIYGVLPELHDSGKATADSKLKCRKDHKHRRAHKHESKPDLRAQHNAKVCESWRKHHPSERR